MTDMSYQNIVSMTDNAIAGTIGAFVQHHRMQQNKTQQAIAYSAGISRSTLSLLERGEPVTLPTLIQVLRVLNQLQVLDAFVVTTPVSPLALVKMQQQKRERASSSTKVKSRKNNW